MRDRDQLLTIIASADGVDGEDTKAVSTGRR